jgi:uncharacterized damage-inducible protein DinB
MSAADGALREQLARFLDWKEAHADFDAAVTGIPPQMRGTVPPGLAHSAWQILEHLRIAQHDILDFSINSGYEEKKWPDDYWPAAAPPTASAWDESVAAYKRDLAAMQALARDPKIDLFGRIPHGGGQTYIREILLVVDHAAYHLGQLVTIRQLLGIWP